MVDGISFIVQSIVKCISRSPLLSSKSSKQNDLDLKTDIVLDVLNKCVTLMENNFQLIFVLPIIDDGSDTKHHLITRFTNLSVPK